MDLINNIKYDHMKRIVNSFSFFTAALSFFCFSLTNAQVPFHKGVNLTGWFQTSSARSIQFTKFTKKDFQNIKSLGCDVIRLPISLHDMTDGSPNYKLDPLFVNFLDKAVDWAEELQIHLILDNHTFDPIAPTDPAIGNILTKVWKQMANHYKDRSNFIYYEVLNEPHGITDAVWSPIQQSVINAIRTEDTKHFIIVGPADYNSYNNLKNLPIYSDTKIIYTFHFYDPFIFTHQGASWVEPSMVPLAGVPFPYNAAKFPATPPSLKGTWVESALNDYVNSGNVAKVKEYINRVIDFRDKNNVLVFCGEFGVYINNSENVDRVNWYNEVSKYLNEKSIPWTIWDYQGGFGLFKKDSKEYFENDINVPLVQALQFNVPTQTEYVKSPLTNGFTLYDDYVGEGILGSGYTNSGTVDFYSATTPRFGNYNIYWTGVGQYESMRFDFIRDTDLSLLKEKDTLEFWVRGSTSSVKFDIRFIDTKISSSDRPWRLGKTIDNTFAKWDGEWHHIQLPLKSLDEKGSYDIDTYYNPEGKFDWTSIDLFEIVPEHQPLTGITFSFDDIKISGEKIITGIENKISSVSLSVFPNPTVNSPTIEYRLLKSGIVNLSLYNSQGQFIKKIVNDWKETGVHISRWSEEDDLPQGLYIIRLETSVGATSTKIVFIRSN
jgi:endoglucanase